MGANFRRPVSAGLSPSHFFSFDGVLVLLSYGFRPLSEFKYYLRRQGNQLLHREDSQAPAMSSKKDCPLCRGSSLFFIFKGQT